jgi:hypothetical protein
VLTTWHIAPERTFGEDRLGTVSDMLAVLVSSPAGFPPLLLGLTEISGIGRVLYCTVPHASVSDHWYGGAVPKSSISPQSTPALPVVLSYLGEMTSSDWPLPVAPRVSGRPTIQ